MHYIPVNYTGLFQSCDVGIQHPLKLAIKHSVLQDIVNDTMRQLDCGIEPNKVSFEKQLNVVRDWSQMKFRLHSYELG